MQTSTTMSRRSCLAAIAGGLMLAGRGLAAEARPDPRIQALLRRTIGIDAHNHIDFALIPQVLAQPDIDIAGALRESGLTAVCMAMALDYQAMTSPHDGYDRFLAGLHSADVQLQRSGIRRALTAADVRAAHAAGRPTVIQSVEGAHWLEGRVERIALGYRRGLRHFGLFHDNDAVPSLGDRNTDAPTHGGMTPLGLAVIRECNRQGVLIDVAHGSEAVVRTALTASKVPVIFSHTGLNTWLANDPLSGQRLYGKLISPDLARAIAGAGGVIGVWNHIALNPAQYGDHIRRMVDLCGIDHVCIGTDLKLTPALGVGGGPGELPRDKAISGEMRHVWPDMPFGFLYAVIEGLVQAGFGEDDIGRICGENYLRVFDAAARGRTAQA